MNVVKCTNGHFFDGDTYTQCPHCGQSVAGNNSSRKMNEQESERRGFWGKSKSKEISFSNRDDSYENNKMDFQSGNTPTDVMEEPIENKVQIQTNYPKTSGTLDFWQTPSLHDEEKVDEKVIEEVQKEETAEKTETSSLKEAVQKASANSEGKTMSYFSVATNSEESAQKQFTEPVVGWLVCIGGKHLGETFCIYSGKNSIGRSADNRIVIALDNSVSRNKHALIVYEPKKRDFYLQPGDSSGLTYLNDEYITESKKITEKACIEIGESKFLFIPLCGESFTWEDYM